MDGTGTSAFEADIIVNGEKIEDIGSFKDADATKVIDAKSLVVAPGFIDCHTHLDFFFSNPRHAKVLESWAHQGVTTIVGGNCGYSPAPINHENDQRPQGEGGPHLCPFLWHHAVAQGLEG